MSISCYETHGYLVMNKKQAYIYLYILIHLDTTERIKKHMCK